MNKFLESISEGLKNHFSSLTWKGSFSEYLDLVEQKPYMHTRTAFQHMNDMIHHFGKYTIHDCGDKIIRYNLFDDPFTSGEHAVYGLDRTIMRLVGNLGTIAKQGGSERIIILHGPAATAKTSIVRLLIKGLENYSQTGKGAMHTFNWLFTEGLHVGSVGYALEGDKKDLESLANVDSGEIASIVPCQLNDNPILLLPKGQRKEFLDKISGGKFNVPKKMLEGELCFNCQNIYNNLLQKYKGNLKKVFRHIQVQRVIVSEIDKTGAATMQPVQNTDGQAPTIAWETSNYNLIAHLLKGIRIHQFEGKWADANRGILHMTDIFMKNGAYLQYLLSAVQEHLVDFNGVQGFIDSVIIGTTNIEQFAGFKENQNNKALNDRIRSVDIGYVLKPSAEAKIYEKQLAEAGYRKVKANDGHMFPHFLSMLSTWGVMTRLQKPDSRYYRMKGVDSEKIEAVTGLDPISKAKLYDGIIDENLESKVQKLLRDKNLQKLVRNEYPSEGMVGISPRRVQDMLTDMISKKETEEAEHEFPKRCLSIHRLFKSLRNLLNEGKEEFLRVESDDEYTEFHEQIGMLEMEYNITVQREIKQSIVGLEPAIIDSKIREYVQNVSAYDRKTTVVNKFTGKSEQPDETKMQWFESLLGIEENEKDKFRSEVLTEIALESNKSGLVDIKSTCKSLSLIFEEALFNEQMQSIGLNFDRLSSAIEKYGTEKFKDIDKAERDIVEKAIKNMIDKYDYCKNCARDVFSYALKEKLLEIDNLVVE